MPKEVPTKVKVELSIEDVMALIDYHHAMLKAIPLHSYKIKNCAGADMAATAAKYLRKRSEFSRILNETWPK
jgi:hypothetical protein